MHKSVRPFTEKRLRKPETSVKDAISQMEHDLPFGILRRENRTIFLDVPMLPKIFHWNDSKRRVPFTFQLDCSENVGTVNGK